MVQTFIPTINNDVEKRLWEAADQLRANSKLKASEYSVPVLGLIFLRFADAKFAVADEEIKKEQPAVPFGNAIDKPPMA